MSGCSPNVENMDEISIMFSMQNLDVGAVSETTLRGGKVTLLLLLLLLLKKIGTARAGEGD